MRSLSERNVGKPSREKDFEHRMKRGENPAFLKRSTCAGEVVTPRRTRNQIKRKGKISEKGKMNIFHDHIVGGKREGGASSRGKEAKRNRRG